MESRSYQRSARNQHRLLQARSRTENGLSRKAPRRRRGRVEYAPAAGDSAIASYRVAVARASLLALSHPSRSLAFTVMLRTQIFVRQHMRQALHLGFPNPTNTKTASCI